MSSCKFCNDEDGDMISCATCNGYCHPSCLELPEHIVPVVKTYDWQCNDCKYCYQCHNFENEKKILFCDACDRGYHTYCVTPRLNRKPRGDWYCAICVANNLNHPENKPEEKSSEGKTKSKVVENKTKDKPPDKRPSKEKLAGNKVKEKHEDYKVKKNKGGETKRPYKRLRNNSRGKEFDSDEDQEMEVQKDEKHSKECATDHENNTNKGGGVDLEADDSAKKKMEIVTENVKDIDKPAADGGSTNEKNKVDSTEEEDKEAKAKKEGKETRDTVHGDVVVENVNKDGGEKSIINKDTEREIASEKNDANKKEEENMEIDVEKDKGEVKEKEVTEKTFQESSEEGIPKKEKKKKEKMETDTEKVKPKKEAGKSKKEKTSKESKKKTNKKDDISSCEEKNVSDSESSKKLTKNDNSTEKENKISNKGRPSQKVPKKSVEKTSSKSTKQKSKKVDNEQISSGSEDKTMENESEKGTCNSENIEQTKNFKKCMYGKKFSEGNNQCPFYGCDGKGNTRNNHNFHISLNNCPMSKESRKREKELMNSSSKEESSPSPPKKKLLQSTLDGEKIKENKDGKEIKDNREGKERKEKETVSQTPIENIVSSTDIELFEQAKSKAVMALCQEMAPNPDGLKSIIFGDVEIDVWYKSQYTIEYSKLPKLYICEFCLCYMKTRTIYERHMAKCKLRNPPGDEIYRKDNHSVFEVNGATATAYCQNLCLMAKLFLDHKTLWLDVAPFLFYIMTINDDKGCHIVGYFSKEKVSFLNYNVSCILVLPHHMKKGYGRLLIDFSYLLSAAEGKTGSPERPLSDMGLISYRKFWAEKLLKYLIDYQEKEISVKAISETMAIQANDVISTLQYLGVLKYWKGKHLILLRKEVIVEYALKVKGRPEDYKEIDANCLTWTPPNARTQ